MSNTCYTGNYTPSGFAIAPRCGGFDADDGKEILIDDGGGAPEVGCVAWLRSWPGDTSPKRGAVTAVETHCNGRVTVSVAF